MAENCRAVVTFYDEEEKGYSLWETEQVNTTTTFIEYLTSKCVLFHNFFGLLSLKNNFGHMIWGRGVKLISEDFSRLFSGVSDITRR